MDGGEGLAYTVIKTWHMWGIVLLLALIIIVQYIMFIFKRSNAQQRVMFADIYKQQAKIFTETNVFVLKIEKMLLAYINKNENLKQANIEAITQKLNEFHDYIIESEFYFTDKMFMQLKEVVVISQNTLLYYERDTKKGILQETFNTIISDYSTKFASIKKTLKKEFRRTIGVSG